MWFLPSRQRPGSLSRFFNAYKATGANSSGVVWLDSEDYDEYLSYGIQMPKGWNIIASPHSDSLGAICNQFFEMHPNEPWYGLLADDLLPRTPFWDRILIHAAGNDGLSYGNDLLRGEAHASHPCIGGDLVRELGWLALPGCKRLYIDDALMEAARRKGKVTYLPEVITEHLHFSNGKSPMDETYAKHGAGSDKAIFEAWKQTL